MKTPADIIAAVLDGNPRGLARAITQVENETELAPAILNQLYKETGRAYLIGVTGAPGTGKSSLVNTLTKHIRQTGQTVAIVAVDPTSPFSQGAVLGDRIRMRELSGDRGIFIRSMATRGSLGGLARATTDVVRVMDAAGYDFIIIETVGAGQSEVAIASTAYTTLVIDVPGLGDDIQATKAGILEIADILVVNKADRPGADNAVRALKAMLDLGHRMVAHHGQLLMQDDGVVPQLDAWQVPVLKTVAVEDDGIAALFAAIQEHRAYLLEAQLMEQRERHRLEVEVAERLQTALLKQVLERVPQASLANLMDQLVARELTPAAAVHELLRKDHP